MHPRKRNILPCLVAEMVRLGKGAVGKGMIYFFVIVLDEQGGNGRSRDGTWARESVSFDRPMRWLDASPSATVAVCVDVMDWSLTNGTAGGSRLCRIKQRRERPMLWIPVDS